MKCERAVEMGPVIPDTLIWRNQTPSNKFETSRVEYYKTSNRDTLRNAPHTREYKKLVIAELEM